MEKQIISAIQSGKAVLGIELGSTRIKAVLIGPDYAPLASGSHDWENRLENGIWTYTMEDCQRRIKIVGKRRRNFVVFRRGGVTEIKRFPAEKEYSRFVVSGA